MMSETLNMHTALPEIIIAVLACVILLYRMYDKSCCPDSMAYWLSLGTLVIGFFATVGSYTTETVYAYSDAFVHDAMSVVAKSAVLLITLGAYLYTPKYNKDRGYFKAEMYILGLFGVVGMMVMSSAASMLSLYVGLELFSLSLYAMIAFYRDTVRAPEAAMKYFVLGAIASAMLLYGMSLLYGLTGSLTISEVRESVAATGLDNLGLILAVVMVVVGLAFKLGAVPFHMWVPDVYEGSATSVTVYLAAAPKIAAFAMVMRLLVDGLDAQHANWQHMLTILAVLSVAVGNIVAIAQTSLKRMLAYSTISHMGFFLFGILSGSLAGYAGSFFYVIIYAVMSLGAFGVILSLADKGHEAEQLDDLKGMFQKSPFVASMMGIIMLSMAGIPPLAGFFAKMSVLSAVIAAGLPGIAIVAVLLAVIGAFYYLRVLKLMFFDEPVEGSHSVSINTGTRVLLGINALVLLLILPWINSLIELTKTAVGS